MLAIGISQRTEPDAIDHIAHNIFNDETSPIDTILAFNIPVSRAFMHLDTVFTQIDVDKFTIHPAIMGTLRVYELTAGKNPGDVNIRLIEDTLEHVLEDATGVDQVKLIPCGGGDRIAAEREQWNDGSNTLCIAPGKIVVYEGLLPLVSSDDELAVVIGHEVAHAVAKHSNERMSQQLMAQYGAAILGAAVSNKSAAVQQAANTVYGVGAQYGVMLPFSRKHESEADYMGLVFMTMAGYNPDVAVNFWQKMSAGKSGSTPEFMSTHPSDATRIAEIQKVLPAIKTKYKK